MTCTGGPIGTGLTGTAIVAAREPVDLQPDHDEPRWAPGGRVRRPGLAGQHHEAGPRRLRRRCVPGRRHGRGGRSVASADTTGGSSATTGDTTILVAADGNPLTFAETRSARPTPHGTRRRRGTARGTASRLRTCPAATPSGRAAPSPSASATRWRAPSRTRVAERPRLTEEAVVADVDGDRLVDAGDRVTWTFTATNTGSVPLEGLAVDDPAAGAVSCVAAALAPGASTTCRTTTRRWCRRRTWTPACW